MATTLLTMSQRAWDSHVALLPTCHWRRAPAALSSSPPLSPTASTTPPVELGSLTLLTPGTQSRGRSRCRTSAPPRPRWSRRRAPARWTPCSPSPSSSSASATTTCTCSWPRSWRGTGQRRSSGATPSRSTPASSPTAPPPSRSCTPWAPRRSPSSTCGCSGACRGAAAEPVGRVLRHAQPDRRRLRLRAPLPADRPRAQAARPRLLHRRRLRLHQGRRGPPAGAGVHRRRRRCVLRQRPP